jgi:hypothetical protein
MFDGTSVRIDTFDYAGSAVLQLFKPLHQNPSILVGDFVVK